MVMSKKRLMSDITNLRIETKNQREKITSLEAQILKANQQVLALKSEVMAVMPLNLKLQELREKAATLSTELTRKISDLLVAQDSLTTSVEKKKAAELEVEECRSSLHRQSKHVSTLETALHSEKARSYALQQQQEESARELAAAHEKLERAEREVKRLERDGASLQTLSLRNVERELMSGTLHPQRLPAMARRRSSARNLLSLAGGAQPPYQQLLDGDGRWLKVARDRGKGKGKGRRRSKRTFTTCRNQGQQEQQLGCLPSCPRACLSSDPSPPPTRARAREAGTPPALEVTPSPRTAPSSRQ